MSILYIVATPIGNLRDITLRAIDVLKHVDIILAEDTRQTRVLLSTYNIKKQILSYRDQNHDKILPKIMSLLQSGKSLALVTDAGTPLVSDPGFKLIRALYNLKADLDFKIVPIPGPSALTCAISISPLPVDKFVFLGFLPRKKGKRLKVLEVFKDIIISLVLYESPFRVVTLLQDILTVYGNVDIFIARELTKKFETTYFGKAKDLLSKFREERIRGEIVIIVYLK